MEIFAVVLFFSIALLWMAQYIYKVVYKPDLLGSEEFRKEMKTLELIEKIDINTLSQDEKKIYTDFLTRLQQCYETATNYKESTILLTLEKKDIENLEIKIDNAATYKQFRESYDTLSLLVSKMQVSLAEFDNFNGSENLGNFKLVSEKELWENRIPPYEYRL